MPDLPIPMSGVLFLCPKEHTTTTHPMSKSTSLTRKQAALAALEAMKRTRLAALRAELRSMEALEACLKQDEFVIVEGGQLLESSQDIEDLLDWIRSTI